MILHNALFQSNNKQIAMQKQIMQPQVGGTSQTDQK